MAERTVLIIDDSETIRQRLESVLKEHEIFQHFLQAKHGVEGFKLLLNNPVDLILCDIVMPEIDGFKFLALKHSKPQFSEIPTIMLTGQEDVRLKVRGLDAGAADYLTKPFHDEELVARVKVHLKIKSLQDELRDKNAHLESLSRIDGLTQMNNRRYFMELLNSEYTRAERYHTPLAFAMLDIDKFKSINDQYGHLAGDQALITLSRVLKRTVRIQDILGRYGGEEFGLIMPHTEEEGGKMAIERCRSQVEQAEVFLDEKTILQITVSIGLVCFPNPRVNDLQELIHLADLALYQAKHDGRNCCRLA